MADVLIEQWKSIKGFEGIYEVSDLGNVRSLDQIQKRSNGKVECTFHVKGQMLKPYLTGNKNEQYLTVKLGKQNFKVHRLVATTFISNPMSKPQINHIDGNKLNNSVSNLEWVTGKENIDHAWKHGLIHTKGEKHPKSKLTQNQIDEIRKVYVKGDLNFGAKPLARKYGVSNTNIRQIIKGEIWKR